MDSYKTHSAGETFRQNKTLISYYGKNKFGHELWMWRCLLCKQDRGPSTISHLNRGDKCLPCSYTRENNGRWKGYKDLTGVWLTQRMKDAEKRGYEWNLTPEYLWELWLEQDGRCWYTRRKLELYANRDNRGSASLDRTDNTIGYVTNNVRWVHTDINRMKSDFSESRFLQLCKDVVVGFDTSAPTVMSDFIKGNL